MPLWVRFPPVTPVVVQVSVVVIELQRLSLKFFVSFKSIGESLMELLVLKEISIGGMSGIYLDENASYLLTLTSGAVIECTWLEKDSVFLTMDGVHLSFTGIAKIRQLVTFEFNNYFAQDIFTVNGVR